MCGGKVLSAYLANYYVNINCNGNKLLKSYLVFDFACSKCCNFATNN